MSSGAAATRAPARAVRCSVRAGAITVPHLQFDSHRVGGEIAVIDHRVDGTVVFAFGDTGKRLLRRVGQAVAADRRARRVPAAPFAQLGLIARGYLVAVFVDVAHDHQIEAMILVAAVGARREVGGCGGRVAFRGRCRVFRSCIPLLPRRRCGRLPARRSGTRIGEGDRRRLQGDHRRHRGRSCPDPLHRACIIVAFRLLHLLPHPLSLIRNQTFWKTLEDVRWPTACFRAVARQSTDAAFPADAVHTFACEGAEGVRADELGILTDWEAITSVHGCGNPQ